jgi:AcrR family transcriptional regulator
MGTRRRSTRLPRDRPARKAGRHAVVTRREILDAGARLFRERGYHATTMADIGAAVGVLGGSLYYHVESKEALLYEIMATATQGLLAALREVSQPPKPAAERLRAAIVNHLQFSTAPERNDYAAVFLNEIGNLRHRHMGRALTELVHHYEDSFAAILEDGIAAGEFRSDLDRRTTVFAILGMENWALRWLRPGGRLTVEEVGQRFADLILHGVVARP